MSCGAIYKRFLELFPNYEGAVSYYKLNKVEPDSIVVGLSNGKRLIFSTNKNLDSLRILK